MVVVIAIAIIYCRLSATLDEARLLLKKTIILLLCLLTNVLVVVYALSIGMYTAYSHQYWQFLWLILSVLYPISLLPFPFGF